MKFGKEPKVGGGGKHFLRLKDKDMALCLCRGEPYEFYVVWEGKKTRPTVEDDPNGRFRFRINVAVQENGAFVAKILEGGPTMYNDLRALNEEFPLDKNFIVIKRTGSGQNDTKYSIMPSSKTKLDAKMAKHIEGIEMLDLGAGDNIEINSSVPQGDDDDSDLPF